ncbi:MAG: isoprenylcysteine carboxylmethyltransferase family protein [Deltaproteobacteria bacterium]|nr:isoprenylcysteine carboxylmethyltransferase family protein [Deltaproteobacteria bacterium]
MEIIGKTTIKPILFYSGKISGYIVWVLLLISLLSTHSINQISLQGWIAVIILCFGLIFTIVSFINLGKSNRLGIPKENTIFKTNGLYKISRNPLYLGFNMLSLSGILFINNFVVLILGVYSIFVYHLIILGEEKFLESHFSKQYSEYKKKVRRYL